jgi:hypothetical protein
MTSYENILTGKTETNYGDNGEKTFEDFEYDEEYHKELRKKIKNLLEEKIKGGINYNESLLGKDARKKALRSRKKRIMKDESQEFMRRHKGGKIGYKKNPWIKFWQKYKEDNPELSSRESMREAGKLWKNM